MKIAVIGVYYASNLGDAVICDCVAHWLKKEYPEAIIDVIDIEGKIEFSSQRSVSIRTLKRRHFNLMRDYWLTRHRISDRVYYWSRIAAESHYDFYNAVAAQNYDAVIFAGGQLFMDWLSLDICGLLERIKGKNIPIFFNACGVGSAISDTITKQLSHYLLNDHVKLISSRDNVEAIEKRYLQNAKTVVATYDPALWTKEVYKIEAKQNDVIGLGIMYSDHAPLWKITDFWKRLIREMEKRHLKWKMFCNGSIDDYQYGCYVLKKLGLSPEKYINQYPKTPQDLIEQIASFESMISFRLHSHIVATALDIPAIAIVWDEKLKFYYQKQKHEERCKTIIDSADTILNALELARQQRYDRDLVEQQKRAAKHLLLSAVKREIEYE